MTELDDIVSFLEKTPPLGAVGRKTLTEISKQINIRYAKRGTHILRAGDINEHLYMVRSGAVELKELGRGLTARIGENSFFAYPSLLRDGKIRNAVTAIEDSLLYMLPASVFHALRADYPVINNFFVSAEAERLRSALQANNEQEMLNNSQKLGSLVQRSPITCAPDMPIQAAAEFMTAQSVSSLLVEDGGKLVGIITDRDFRARVLAGKQGLDAPVRDIMTASPHTLYASQTVLDALILMSEHSCHHLPILDSNQNLLGMISANDVLAEQSVGAVPIARTIRKAQSAQEIANTLGRIPRMASNLIDSSVDGAPTASQIASVGLAVHRKIIELAEADLGPAPVPYCFLVFGSLARRDQTLSTDQDNGLLLSDAYQPDIHGAYFEALANRICSDLDKCGYPFCGGGIMAQNPKWRQNLTGWKAVFENWILQPEPKALMHASIFFDSAAIWGDSSLRDALLEHIMPLAQKNRLFLAHMVKNALSSKVPIGFFRRFVLTHDENHEDSLDIKKNGLVALVDVARTYALAHGIKTAGFVNRMEALKQTSDIAKADLQEMLDAWHFMMTIRLAHQVQQCKHGKKPDNMIAPNQLSAFEREHLRDAFSLIKTHQEGLSRSLAGGHY